MRCDHADMIIGRGWHRNVGRLEVFGKECVNHLRACRIVLPAFLSVLNRGRVHIVPHLGRTAVLAEIGLQAGAERRQAVTTGGDKVRAEAPREPSSSSSQAPSSKYRLYRPALIAAGIGLLATLVGTIAVGRWENRLARADFESMAEAQATLIQNGINEYVSRLTALRTRFESANDDITRNEYQTFSTRLFEEHPGLVRVSWLPRITRKERGEYEAAAITDGVPAFRIKAYPDGAARAGRQRIFPGLFLHRAEDLDRLWARLLEHSRTARDAGAGPRL